MNFKRVHDNKMNAQQFPRKAENPILFQFSNEPKALFSSRFDDQNYVRKMLENDPEYTRKLLKKYKWKSIEEALPHLSGCNVNTDYSQLELRIAALISGDETFIEAYKAGKDVHKLTASTAWSVPIEEVTKDMRTAAKAVSFGVIYGKSYVTLGKEIYMFPPYNYSEKKAIAEGKKLQQSYFTTYPKLKVWLDEAVAFAKKNGYVETMFGFRRRLPNIKSKVQGIKSNAERQAKNSPIQGTGSYCTLLSMIKIVNKFNELNLKSKLVCTVHDSLVLDVFVPELPIVSKLAVELMEHAADEFFDIPFPLASDIECGTTYGSVHECSVAELQDLDTKEKFDAWNQAKNHEKHMYSVDYMKKKLNMSEAQVQEYIKEHGWLDVL